MVSLDGTLYEHQEEVDLEALRSGQRICLGKTIWVQIPALPGPSPSGGLINRA